MQHQKSGFFISFLMISVVTGFFTGTLGAIIVVQHVGGMRGMQSEIKTPLVLSEDSLSTVALVEQTSDAVVSIRAVFHDSMQSGVDVGNTGVDVPRFGSGSGFLVSADGLILTNRHVVDSDSVSYVVTFNDGSAFDAQVVALDPLNDIALLKIDVSDRRFLKLGDSDSLLIGQTVIAIGNALGEFDNSVTKGIVSGIDRRIVASDGLKQGTIESAIQTDAAVNSGNSGGPLLDELGYVVGINTAVSQRGQSIGFAIPINTARLVVESYQEYGRIVRPWLGVRYTLVHIKGKQVDGHDVMFGALIIDGGDEDPGVLRDSPADKAGLQERDVIISIDGEYISEMQSPARLIARHAVGDEIALEIIREGEVVGLRATLEELSLDLLK